MKIVAASHSTIKRRSRLASAGRVLTSLVVAFFFGMSNASYGQAPASAGVATQAGASGQPQGQGSSQGGAAQGQSASPDAAGSQLAQFFQVSGSRELQGEALTLERLLYGIYSPAERNRRLAAYWDLAGRNAQYNLCVVCGGYVAECAGKVSQQDTSEPTQRLVTSARQIALGRQTAARLKFLQGQYDFDAAFTSAAGRRAAIQRAADSGVKSYDAKSGVVFYIPSARPASDVYQTRYSEIAPYLGGSSEAARLSSLIPLLYETLQARATQTARELDVLVSLANGAQFVPTTLFGAVERYRESASQMIDAAVRYNQAIAAYSTLVTPANIQGAAFLATINQRPSAQNQQRQQQQQQRPPQSGTQPAAGAATGADVGTPRVGVPQRFVYYLPGYLPDGVREVSQESQTPRSTGSQAVVAATSDAAQVEAPSLASIQPLAPLALAVSGAAAVDAVDAAPIVARNLDSEATFAQVAYTRPLAQTPTPSATSDAAPAAQEPTPAQPAEPPAATETKPGAETSQPAPESAPAQPSTSAPAPETAPQPEQPPVQETKPEPLPQPAPAPEQPEESPAEAKPDESVLNQPDSPIIVVITGYEQPLKSGVESKSGETEQATASGSSSPTSPDGAWLLPVRAETLLFAAVRAFFLAPNANSDATQDAEYVVRGQDITLPDDYGTAPAAATSAAAPAPATAVAPAPVATATPAPAPAAAANATPNTTDGRRVDVAQIRALVAALFAIETAPTPSGDGQERIYERLYTLHEIASRANQSPAGRRAVARAYWKLQGACARLRVEETIFRNFTLVYNNLDQTTVAGDLGRACLAAALEQQARIAEAKTLKRAAQTELLRYLGLSSANADLPLPATLPFCDAKFNPLIPGYPDDRTFRTAALVQARLKATLEYGATLDQPGLLLNVDTNAVSAANVELLVATLQKKRETALLFVDQVVALNFAIADSVAFFPARLASDQFVDALAGRR